MLRTPESFSLSQTHLCGFSHPPSWQAGDATTLPFHLLGMMLAEMVGCTVMPHCRAPGWVEPTPLSLTISQGLGAFLTCTNCPETPRSTGVGEHSHWGMTPFPRCLPPRWLPRCPVIHFTTTLLTPASSVQGCFPPPLCPTGDMLSRVSEEGDEVSPEGTWLSPAGHTGIMGVSLTAGPRCDLASGDSTQVFPVWSAPRHLSVIKQY